ncbi:hypothetical protein BGZ94_005235 [Podila epigama]|nr:hypothetical protein BGZ94_005235 [Podila epigama]
MYSRYPPQNRMPTLAPHGIDRLWYPTSTNVANMHDELLQEEESYNQSLREVRQSSTHYIPIGASKPFVDLDEFDDEDDQEEDEDEDEEGGMDDEEDYRHHHHHGVQEQIQDQELGQEDDGEDDDMMGRDLDADIEDADYDDQQVTEVYSPNTAALLYGGYRPQAHHPQEAIDDVEDEEDLDIDVVEASPQPSRYDDDEDIGENNGNEESLP